MRPDDEAEFVSLVESCSGRLLRAAWLMTGSAAAAEDLVQSTFEKVYVAWRRIDRAAAVAYAKRVLLNEHIDTTRKRSRERLVSEPPEMGWLDQEPSSAAYLVAALRQLTPREREVVVMRHYADMSESDVAASLGVSVGTVKSTSSRALARLRSVLAAEGDSHVR
ncbi:MAG: SigE family RNA polymerase sigma factor [Intrasporangium sp.]|uniref:SigE family RNA polymerase sigma factor n=1 Tax=Intrasporangium sp. TaxID=1925024 RepID=UPI003F7CD852